MKKRTIIHLDADAFFASVEQGFNPLLRDKSVLVGGFATERGCVHTANYKARRAGIYTGMSLREAEEICPDAVFLKGDYRHYRAAGITIESILRKISPRVEMGSLDDSYIDVTGFERFYGSPLVIAYRIKEEIWEALKITVSIGIATSKLIARIASATNKPDGITWVPSGKEREFLSPLSIREIPGIGRKIENLFHGINVMKIGELARLSKEFVIQITGSKNGEKIWEYAHAIDNRPVKVKEIAKQISRETSFVEDTGDDNFILAALSYLSDRIGKKLRDENWVCRRVSLKLRYSDNKSAVQSKSMSEYTDDGKTIFSFVKTLYIKIRTRQIRICFVAVLVSEIDYKERQGFLFKETVKYNDVNKSADKVRNNFGFTSLFPARTLVLKTKYRMEKHGYILRTPALSQ